MILHVTAILEATDQHGDDIAARLSYSDGNLVIELPERADDFELRLNREDLAKALSLLDRFRDIEHGGDK